jgi:hypothetical protein
MSSTDTIKEKINDEEYLNLCNVLKELNEIKEESKDDDDDDDDDEDESEDEDAVKLVDRKISLNRTNVIGLNLESYNAFKPSKEVSRMISNLLIEYN